MADRVSQRRQAANSFYLSVNTLLVGGSAYLGTLAPKSQNIILISIAGVAICVLWVMNIKSYKTLNGAKFLVINDIELRLLEKPFHREWENLDPKNSGERHRPFHTVEVIVPWVFVALYGVQLLFAVPWSSLRRWMCG
jgi:hypothetical protein